MKGFRWWWLLLLLPIAAGVIRLRFEVEVLELLPDSVPAVAGLKVYQQHFSNARELVVAIRAEDAATATAVARRIAERMRDATHLAANVTWQSPEREDPGLIAELLAYLWLNQPPGEMDRLAIRLSPANLPGVLGEALEQLGATFSPAEMARLSYDPYGLTRLPENVSGMAGSFGGGEDMFAGADGRFRLVFIQARSDLPGYQECTEWLKAVSAIVSEAAPDGVDLGFTGRPAFVAEISSSMRRDMIFSVIGTSVIIAVLFWLAHRRLKPMVWLLALLAFVLAGTVALGGLLIGTINVISVGFAAILLGLAVDYAMVHYQEALAEPQLSIPQVRRAMAPAILWASVTTISAFMVLNFSGLPGLAQLGSLVAIGVALSAVVMIYAFLPPLFPDRIQQGAAAIGEAEFVRTAAPAGPWRARLAWGGTTLLVVSAGAVLWREQPSLDASADALRPRESRAYATLEAIQRNMSRSGDPLWLVVGGDNEVEVGEKLDAIRPILQGAVSNGVLTSFAMPDAIWPRPDHQEVNRQSAQQLVSDRVELRRAALAARFSETSLNLTESILDTWERALASTNVFRPANSFSSWIFNRFAARGSGRYYAAAFMFPGPRVEALEDWEARFGIPDVWLSGWKLLGGTVLARVQENLWILLPAMGGLILASLWLAFRRPLEVALSLGVLLLSGLTLMALMVVFGWSWNLLNLMALPLILGTGVDYGIFMQLALRRHGGDVTAAWRSAGRALLLCGATAITGFGFLAFSSNAGMASLGRVCAMGIAGNMLCSLYLLPVWWNAFRGGSERRLSIQPQSRPSQFYRARLWQIGRWLVGMLPLRLSRSLARMAAAVYWRLAPHRREIVRRNLEPVVGGDASRARQAARGLFDEFALKVLDLWRYECGVVDGGWLLDWTGWEIYQQAEARGRGVLLVTPHLGNWELGGPLMARHDRRILVITQEEPDPRLTAMRLSSRERWGVETVVVGRDTFAFVEVIRKLQEGATVALLVDRPSESKVGRADLFGRDLRVSMAPAELARASGCAIVPTFIVREPEGYRARILPEIRYDRSRIGFLEERLNLTREIVRAFEPAIRQYPEQWYHFVPIWPAESPCND